MAEILVIEDDALVGKTLVDLLNLHGYQARQAESGEQGLERLQTGSFDLVSVAFGLRNMTHKEQALAEMARVLKPGGRLVVLEFSKVWAPLQPAYDLYSFRVLPWLGERVAGAAEPYRYLTESIRLHPDQAALQAMMERAGLSQVEVFNLAAGVVAVHRGIRFW